MSSIHCIVLGIVLATAVAGATFFPTLSFSADSGTGPGSGGPREAPCREEIKKFCSGIQPGGGRILECIKQNAASLSPACRNYPK